MSSNSSRNDSQLPQLRYLPEHRGIGCVLDYLDDLSRPPEPERYSSPQTRLRLELQPGRARLVRFELTEHRAGHESQDAEVLFDWEFERLDSLPTSERVRLEYHLGQPLSDAVHAAFTDPACLAPEGQGSEARHRALLESLEVCLVADDAPDRNEHGTLRPYVQLRLGIVDRADHFELRGPSDGESTHLVLWLGRDRLGLCRQDSDAEHRADAAHREWLAQWSTGSPATLSPDARERIAEAFGPEIGELASWFAEAPERWLRS